MTVLHMASAISEEALYSVIQCLMRDEGIGPDEIRKRINTNNGDEAPTGGYYPLHYACQAGRPGVVRLLLESRAEPNVTKNNNATPLLTAIFAGGHHPERLHDYEACARLLLEHPDFDLKINDATTHCCPTWVCVREYPQHDHLLPLLKLMLARGFDPNATLNGMPALHMALENGHKESAAALARAGADIHGERAWVDCGDGGRRNGGGLVGCGEKNRRVSHSCGLISNLK